MASALLLDLLAGYFALFTSSPRRIAESVSRTQNFFNMR
jgi:hypothetical protein